MIVRYATAEDMRQWFETLPGTIRAVVVEHDGRLLAIAGLIRMGDHMQCFSSMKDELRPHKYVMGKAALMVRSMVREVRGPVFAVCSVKEPTAPALLTALGFKPYAEEVWRHG